MISITVIMFRSSLALAVVGMLGLLAQAQDQPARQYLATIYPEAVKIAESFKSPMLREETRRQAILLTSGDSQSVTGAILFFADLRAKDVLLRALSDWSLSFEHRAETARALREIAACNDMTVLTVAVRELENSDMPSSGGSEVQIPRRIYRYTLVALIETITSMELVPEEIRRQAASRAVDWTDFTEPGLPEGHTQRILEAVNAWKSKRAQED